MSPAVDDRIVSIKFDNAQFEKNIQQTIKSIQTLTDKLTGLNQLSAQKGLGAMAAAASSTKPALDQMAQGVDKIAGRFGALGAIAFTVIQKLTQDVMGFVSSFVQQDILAPLITGGKTRAQAIEMAQFQFRGLGMNVQEVMQNALDAVKNTAYGLGEAASAAAQFGASGISAGDDMMKSLRAIAGTAAMTGRSYSEMAMIFTSSAATGKVNNQDLLQFATRGLNAAAAFAKQTGVTEAQVHEMAAQGTLDYKTFAEAMYNAFGEHAVKANETYAGSLANMHAALSRIGASFFAPWLVQQRDLFNAITPLIDNFNKALQPLIYTISGIRGSLNTDLIKAINSIDLSRFKLAIPNFAVGFQAIFDSIKQFVIIIRSAFREIFPPEAISVIYSISEIFKNLAQNLKMGAETAEKVKSIFAGFFAVVSIGWEVLKGIVLVIQDIVKALFPAGHGILNASASFGDFLVKLQQTLVEGGKIHDFFERLGQILAKPAAAIGELINKITSFFSKSEETGKATSAFDNVAQHINRLGDFWTSFYERFQKVFQVFDKVWEYIKNWFSELGQKIADALKPDDFSAVADVVNVGLLGAIAVMLKNFTTGGLRIGLGGGVFGVIQSNLIALTRTLNQMQAKIQADTIFKLAAAVGILAISLTIMAGIDSVKLTKAIGGMSVAMGELVAVMKILQSNVKGAFGMTIISGAMIAMASAMLILSAAIKNLSSLSWEQLAKGLAGVAVGLGLMVGASKLIAGNAAGMVAAGMGMIAMSIGLRILANAVQALATLSWEALGKGLAGVAVGLGVLTAAMKLMPASSIISGAGLIEMAIGLRILANAVAAFGDLSWSELGKGLLGISGGLLAIALAMNFMPLSLPITAAGLLILSFGLKKVAEAVTIMGKNDMGSLAKGIGGLAAVLVVLVIAMAAMQGSVIGAAAMLIVAHSLAVLAEVITKFAGLSIAQIATGIGAIAAALLVVGLAAAVLEPVIPAMLGLGIAMGILGGAFALFGLGAMLVADAFQVMAAAGVAGTAAILKSLEMLLKAIPMLAAAAAMFVVTFVEEIGKGIPTIIKVFTAILEQILVTVIKEVPLIVLALGEIITGFCALVITQAPLLIETAWFFITQFLQGIRDNIYQTTTLVIEIFAAWVQACINNMPTIVGSAVNLIVSFLTELAKHGEELAAAGLNVLTQFLLGIASHIGDVVAAVGTIIVTFINEVSNQIQRIIDAGANLIIKFIQGLGQHSLEIIKAAFQAILDFLNGLANAIDYYAPQIRAAGLRLVVAIIEGVTGADLSKMKNFITSIPGKIIGWAGDFADQVWDIGANIVKGIWKGIDRMADWFQQKVWGWIKAHIPGWLQWVLGIGSPSKVMMPIGYAIVEGLMVGVGNGSKMVKDQMTILSNQVQDGFNPDPKDLTSIFARMASQLSDMDEFNPVITPVLDLTKVESAAKNISGYMKAAVITPDVSIQQARIISVATAELGATSSPSTSSEPTQLTFEQTIISPKALSTDDIYRNTRNQITLAKEELDIP